jgi:hypothetical protein
MGLFDMLGAREAGLYDQQYGQYYPPGYQMGYQPQGYQQGW